MIRFITRVALGLYVFLSACSSPTSEIITTTETKAFSALHDYKISFPVEKDVLFYQVHMKCQNTMSYSENELEFLSYKNLSNLGSEDIESVKILEDKLKKNTYKVLINDTQVTRIELDKIESSMIISRADHCDCVTNSLFEVSYRPEGEEDENVRYKYEIGFVPYGEILKSVPVGEEASPDDEMKIDWKKTLSQKKVLFWMYKGSSLCKDHPFSLRFLDE